MTYFSLLAYRILKRKKQRINLIFSLFFISINIALILNMIYAPIPAQTNESIILILSFLTYFFVCFGTIFLLIVHMIIVESTIIYSVKRQNRYILLYGILLATGMLILVLIGLSLDEPLNNRPLFGVDPTPESPNLVPQWGSIFLIYVLSIMSGFSIIPIIRTSLKIYSSIETKVLKRKWLYYFIGSLGLIIVLYIMLIDNLYLGDDFRLLTSILGVTVIFWCYLMYYGIGFKLKQ